MALRFGPSQHRNTYIPPSVEKSISKHMDRMPAHLKKYQEGGYVPKHAEKARSLGPAFCPLAAKAATTSC